MIVPSMQTPWLLLLGSLRLKGDSDRRADETNGETTVVATDFVSSNEEARESWREGKEKKEPIERENKLLESVGSLFSRSAWK